MTTEPIYLYTDGASKGNPGPGGLGVVLKYKDKRKELSQGFKRTTNNRMELLAVIEGLRAIKQPNYPVIVYSDSKYVVDAINKNWLMKWEQKNFKNRKNTDLWKTLLELIRKFDNLEFRWLRGHAGHEENEVCDELAVNASKNPEKEDTGYDG